MSGYAEIVAAATYVIETTTGATMPVTPTTTPALGVHRAIIAARALAGTAPMILWIHETAATAWGLPDDPPDMKDGDEPDKLVGMLPFLPADARSSPGWCRVDSSTHLSLPAWSGNFAGLDSPAVLAHAVALFHEQVGTPFVYSAPASALFLIDDRRLARPSQPSGVPYAESAFARPDHTWYSEPFGLVKGGPPLAQLFDRRGAYLAAWRSIELPDGEWERFPGAGMPHRTHAAPGYYLVDVAPLAPFLEAQGLHDPFVRAQRRGDTREDYERRTGPVWLTAPLFDLAGELAEEAGVPLRVDRYVISTKTVRPLDKVAERLANTRKTLEPLAGPAPKAVLDAVKDAYTRGTSHFEFGRRAPHPLYRPEWRHTIIDRHVANTYRSLRKAKVRPLIVGGVDSAVFLVGSASEWPDGLTSGSDLGAWRRRGVPVRLKASLKKIKDGGPRAFLSALIEAA